MKKKLFECCECGEMVAKVDPCCADTNDPHVRYCADCIDVAKQDCYEAKQMNDFYFRDNSPVSYDEQFADYMGF
jgi:hypothetical protein